MSEAPGVPVRHPAYPFLSGFADAHPDLVAHRFYAFTAEQWRADG